jgi:nucleoside-triphosphatase THEP1
MNSRLLSEKWIKASIAGTIWAASEIVLGSFLHNLKVPFSGNILTAIGIIILISISHKWTERGLFWRAGLICAIMKTMSPSAVIFGPMIAIFAESVLLEISVSLLGRTFAGFALGGMLAMSWNLFQKIINYIIFYGYNIVEVYSNLLKYAQKQLNIQFDLVWLPILFMLAVYCLFGLISALFGIRVGKKIINQPVEFEPSKSSATAHEKGKRPEAEFDYSITWLVINIMFIVGSLVLLSYTSWIYWSCSIIAIITIWTIRYKRAVRQLSKPKFWIIFVVITMITAFIFTRVQAGGGSLRQGLMIGIQMNFRAAVIIVGFSVLGTELYNPKVRDFFLRTSFKQFPLALELSFDSLPLMISHIPEFKTIMKNPVLVISQFLALADFRLARIKGKSDFRQKIFILTGVIGQGKTSKVQQIVKIFNEKKITVGGIYSPKVIDVNGATIGYDIVDIRRNRREEFLRLAKNKNSKIVGRYSIIQKGLRLGLNALNISDNFDNQVVVIDEVGHLELVDQGWAPKLNYLLKSGNNHLLLVIRESLLEKALRKWSMDTPVIIDISQSKNTPTDEIILSGIM